MQKWAYGSLLLSENTKEYVQFSGLDKEDTMRGRFTATLLLLATLAGCNRSPGALEGTWKSEGIMPMTIAFRPGETEAMGVIEQVSYVTEGNVVKVTYKDGMMKGSSIAFTIIDKNTAINPLYTLHRIR
jgi:hypothetical protein